MVIWMIYKIRIEDRFHAEEILNLCSETFRQKHFPELEPYPDHHSGDKEVWFQTGTPIDKIRRRINKLWTEILVDIENQEYTALLLSTKHGAFAFRKIIKGFVR